MRVDYISPSTLPSRAANAVHVAWQCDGLVKAGAGVTLYAKRSVPDATSLPEALEAAYGISATALSLATFFGTAARADTLRIAGFAARRIGRRRGGDAIVSRNLYAAFLFGVLKRRPLVFETHQLEHGARKPIQRLVMTRPWVTTVVISKRLREHLEHHHGTSPSHTVVLHDAAPDGIRPLDVGDRRSTLRTLVPDAAGPWDAICGYFGHLYAGRGIEVIEAVAALRPRTLFLIYGGNEADVSARRKSNALPNVKFMGHVTHVEARRLMRAFDVLLMPYQTRVSIGVAGHDTANWMSPMKMFEYLATGVPVVASDLAALREVLRHESNALLVAPDRPDEWVIAIDRLSSDGRLGWQLGIQAHADYREKHTWTRRAEALLEAARGL
jgi:glycosyltransferase involved in cell wall biosynthesis